MQTNSLKNLVYVFVDAEGQLVVGDSVIQTQQYFLNTTKIFLCHSYFEERQQPPEAHQADHCQQVKGDGPAGNGLGDVSNAGLPSRRETGTYRR